MTFGCTMRGVCGKDGDLFQNCPYGGPPIPVSIDDKTNLRDLCPRLFQDENVAVCCNQAQIEILQKQMTVPQQLLGKCPSCYSNFINFWCQFACSPFQRSFVSILETRLDDKSINNRSYITKVEYRVDRDYAQGLYDSCKSVRTSNGDYVLSAMCGGMSVDDCGPAEWFEFLGSYSKEVNVPFDIAVRIQDANSSIYDGKMNVMHSRSDVCHLGSDFSLTGCSCVDCEASCMAEEPFPNLTDQTCVMASMDCTTAMTVLAFGSLCLTVMFIVVAYYVVNNSANDDEQLSPRYIPAEEGEFKGDAEIGLFQKEWTTLICEKYAKFAVRNGLLLSSTSVLLAIAFSTGMSRISLTTDPVKLWSSPTSPALINRQYFSRTFQPFFRVQQIIIVPTNQSSFEVDEDLEIIEYGPIFEEHFFGAAFNLSDSILKLQSPSGVRLPDICYKPLWPDNQNCAVLSAFNYFQNDLNSVNQEVPDFMGSFKFGDHLAQCLRSPFMLQTKFRRSCFGAFGGPLQPYMVVGGYDEEIGYQTGRALLMTLLFNNYDNAEDNINAMEWEKNFMEFMENYQSDLFSFTYMSQRSIQDEIERESSSDTWTVVLSYIVMWGYLFWSLSDFTTYEGEFISAFIGSKFFLGAAEIFVVMLSVISTSGILAYSNMPATLITFEVLPFLILAVGVDNVFLFVHAYRRQMQSPPEDGLGNLENRMIDVCSEVIPSIALSSISEAICFVFGTFSSMPAVRSFSYHAGLAIIINFLLHMACFIPAFIADIRRQEAGCPELFCWKKFPPPEVPTDNLFRSFFKNCYAPLLIQSPLRFLMMLVFLFWTASSVCIFNQIKLGLDQKMAVPMDSHVLHHFINMEKYLNVGPPIFFVLKGSLDYSDHSVQNLLCTGIGCAKDSLGAQVARAARFHKQSTIAHPALNWIDDYIEWLRPAMHSRCCRTFSSNGTFCSSMATNPECASCNVTYTEGRPRPDQFYKYLPYFLSDNPTINCPRAGHAFYSNAVKMAKRSNRVISSHFMTYHTPLSTAEDFIKSMQSATFLAQNITRTINAELAEIGHSPIEVFAHSEHYVFYEQYNGIVKSAILQLICSLVCIFVVTTALMGGDPWSAILIVMTVTFILLNLLGYMYLCGIDFNAISVVNLIMSIGISVEFCSHMVHAFVKCSGETRAVRALEALSTVGESVLSGITMTKFGGIAVLGFARSQIFTVFFFRMFFGVVLIGAAHGLIFLPLLLSFLGPPPVVRMAKNWQNSDSSVILQKKTNQQIFYGRIQQKLICQAE